MVSNVSELQVVRFSHHKKNDTASGSTAKASSTAPVPSPSRASRSAKPYDAVGVVGPCRSPVARCGEDEGVVNVVFTVGPVLTDERV